ncbi:MAG: SpoIID/LytB domain-containing protein [Candidatus Levybacteria bacterium]|nr:SpoIID/LytB domain-containing protein [Candidatus Levybacteria bacterium]
MKRLLFLFFSFVFVFCLTAVFAPKISSDELDDINTQINDLTTSLNMSIKATRPLESELNSLQKRITDIKTRVKTIEEDVAQKRKNIDKGYKDLARQEAILNRTIRDYYIRSYYDSPLLVLLSAQSASEITQILAYQKAAADQDKAIITNIALSIVDLEEKKGQLEIEQTRLAALKTTLDEQSAKLDKIVSGAKAYQAVLSSQIAQLSAKQQQLIAQRLGSLNIPRSAATAAPACIDDRDKDSGFSPRLAFFTYGVPNRTGLNQYGAWGRAKVGQGEDDILRAYYEGIGFETRDNITIKVQGYGEMSLETYLLGIYEMPDSWSENNLSALKAQVIAARSYALAYTNNGADEICTTQSCQVYKGGDKGGNWKSAVEQTSGKVMTKDGQVIKAWYSSTHGGYAFPTSELPGWSATSWTKKVIDTTTGSVGSFGELQSNAYDRESPWFYCDWGSRSQYNKTAWLRPEEVADIVNVILLARADSSTKDHFYQTDKPHPYGGEVWNEERVKSELRSRNITPYDTISDISVNVDFSSGKTTFVSVSGQSFSGSEFKDWFNLRAPANIQIVGPLYNVERK